MSLRKIQNITTSIDCEVATRHPETRKNSRLYWGKAVVEEGGLVPRTLTNVAEPHSVADRPWNFEHASVFSRACTAGKPPRVRRQGFVLVQKPILLRFSSSCALCAGLQDKILFFLLLLSCLGGSCEVTRLFLRHQADPLDNEVVMNLQAYYCTKTGVQRRWSSRSERWQPSRNRQKKYLYVRRRDENNV